jgi:hypothetical protein
MDDKGRKLRVLELMGYIAAFMVGAGGLVSDEALKFVNTIGLVFAIIVIVRLLVIDISSHQYEELDIPQPSDVTLNLPEDEDDLTAL